jgi:hypothetical protein
VLVPLRDPAPGIRLRPTEVNGGPGILVFDDRQRLVGVTALEIATGEIKAIRSKS